MKKVVLRISVLLMIIFAGALVSFAQSTKIENNKGGATFSLKASETKLWNVDVKKKQPICFFVEVDSNNFVFTFNSQNVAVNQQNPVCFTPSTTADGNYEIKLVNKGTTPAKGAFNYRKEIQY